MADFVKKPLAASLNEVAIRRAGQAIDLLGKALPASVVELLSSGIVKVKFEVDGGVFTLPQVVVPVDGPEYLRVPLQVGAKGLVRPADVRLGGVSGLGGGTPTLTTPGNLSALVFCPIGSTAWPVMAGTATYLVGYGPDGVRLQSVDGSMHVLIDDVANTIELKNGTQTVTLSATEIKLDGTVIINGVAYTAHQHSGVTAGAANTGGVV